MNAGDIIPAFIKAMEAAGVAPAESIAQSLSGGALVRFQVEGDRNGRRNGWAVLHLDGHPAGAFGCNKRQISDTWKADTEPRVFTAADRAEYRAKIQAQQVERERLKVAARQAAAVEAERIFAASSDASPSHPYLIKKGIGPEGFRQEGRRLVVPMRDVAGKLWNVQRIGSDGFKAFLKGGRVDGLMWIVGKPDGVVCIGEGAGTMAAVRRATGHAVVAAFSAKNLEPVACDVSMAFPDTDLIICADDDAHLIDHPNIKRNLGIDAAHAAAVAVGGRVAVPPRSEAHG